ncbi:uncharacterized protein LOC134819615 [Bolinopsis microptera]|uniref:uncharacterized protein LOC134819615 n=1 Tax=Bolinopsis microptera TaxID=2820187 RepID=UPI003079E3AD
MIRGLRNLHHAKNLQQISVSFKYFSAKTEGRKISKLLIANRGEIAIRVTRAAHELSLKSVAIYGTEDRYSMHRAGATESYEIPGYKDSPVRAYLDQDAIIKIALQAGAEAIHPGYGFLSENAEFIKKCEDSGIIFVGPPSHVVQGLGDKTAARDTAIAAGLPVIPGSDNTVTLSEGREFAEKYGLPVMLKAVHGGGGRGMRVVKEMSQFNDSFQACVREAEQAFGNGDMFIEKFLDRPRHIEVQILGDKHGNIIHLFERDCSVQRRHQKVVEIAPSVNLDPVLREKMLSDAVKLAEHIGYINAGTVEFLVDNIGNHYFMEVNPRIQVEHTVTEEVTGVDIVCSQLEVAMGTSLPELGLSQDKVECVGSSIQCRITTEDPENGFIPDNGRIITYRSPGGYGVRLDRGSGYSGSVITPYYDSLLAKCITTSSSFDRAVAKMVQALSDFRVRGVKTNIAFLERVMHHPDFISGNIDTSFIEKESDYLLAPWDDKSGMLNTLRYLSEVMVNGTDIPGLQGKPGANPIPLAPVEEVYQRGYKQVLDEGGPDALARAVRQKSGLLLTDTTWRDAHQSSLMTRMRTHDLCKAAPMTAKYMNNLFSIEMWGGATFDVALRFLHECPWRRLERLREAVPNIPFQMLLRGANGVGYTSYPDNVVYEFVKQSSEAGVDIFRVFDSLNFVDNMLLGIDAVRQTKGVAEAAICYTGDLSATNGGGKYNIDYYLNLAKVFVEAGAHILCVKDMAGLLKPAAATTLISALRAEFPDTPIHVHTHDTAGTGVASMVACYQAGADIVDVATDAMSGVTSQPSMGAVLNSLPAINSDFDQERLFEINNYWEQVRQLYRCFDPGTQATNTEVYKHEIPGGQYTNMLFQAQSLGLGSEWKRVKQAYTEANQILGDIVKVTPSSKVVGDMAQVMVSNKLSKEDVLRDAGSLNLPTSVIQYLQGYLGEPEGGFPEPFRTTALKGKPMVTGRPGAALQPLDLEQIKKDLTEKYGSWITDRDVMSYAMYPAVFEEFAQHFNMYGDVSKLTSDMVFKPLEVGKEYIYDPSKGKRAYIMPIALGQVDPKTAEQDVFFELNGAPKRITVANKSSAATVITRKKADPAMKNQVGAPMSANILEVRVTEGVKVAAGDPLCLLSAMKMETVISSPISGTVTSVEVSSGESIGAQDLMFVITPN